MKYTNFYNIKGLDVSIIKEGRFKALPIYFFLVIVFSILIFTIFNLQVVEGLNQNKQISIIRSSSVIRASRGSIYDRNGILLAYDTSTYRLTLNTSKLAVEEEEQVLKQISRVAGRGENEIYDFFKSKIYFDAKRIDIDDLTILSSMSRDQMFNMYEIVKNREAFKVEQNFSRKYVYGEEMYHILGYVGEISLEEKKQNPLLQNGDLSGKIGIEKYYNDQLRGTNGRKIFDQSNFSTPIENVEAINGKDVYLTIDVVLQKKLYEAVRKEVIADKLKSGAAIIMDAKTGEIIALASYPSANSNDFASGISNEKYNSLINDDALPLLNRVISEAEPPGSTFKTIVSLAALNEKVIDSKSTFVSDGCMKLNDEQQFCEASKTRMGVVNLKTALTRSSNIYFCNTMLRLGIDKLNFYTNMLPLGKKTGVDLPGEISGSISSKEYKARVFNDFGWYDGDSCNTAVGQGFTQTTPIQMASIASVIANGGEIVLPHLFLKSTKNGEVDSTFTNQKTELNLEKNNFALIREGMRNAVLNPQGTGWLLNDIKENPSIKTGSAESVKGKNAHSWTIGFYPYENPRYAFSSFLQNGSWGFYSATIMRDFFKSL